MASRGNSGYVFVSQLRNRATFATVHAMAPATSCVAMPVALGPDNVADWPAPSELPIT